MGKLVIYIIIAEKLNPSTEFKRIQVFNSLYCMIFTHFFTPDLQVLYGHDRKWVVRERRDAWKLITRLAVEVTSSDFDGKTRN